MDDITTLTLTVDDEKPNQRLDRFLADAVSALSRTRIKALIEEGVVTINGTPPAKPRDTVIAGDVITLIMPKLRPASPKPQAIALTVVYEDDSLLVIDKPAGLVCHPSPGHYDNTLVNALLHHCGDSLSGIGGEIRPGIVHRLDKDTSGLLVVAKHDKAHQGLSEQFMNHGRDGRLKRSYMAFCWRALHPHTGVIRDWIDRDNRDRQKQAISPEGKGRYAETHYQTTKLYFAAEDLKQDNVLVSEVKCTLMTGRTHQIRVHLASRRAPLLADMTYGAHYASKSRRLTLEQQEALTALKGRQALHAAELGFIHPISGEALYFTSELPNDLKLLKANLEKTSARKV